MITIKIASPRYPPALREFLMGLPWEVKKKASSAYASSLLNYLRQNTEVPEKYVTREAAYGVPFFTELQRRWFFWALGTGQIDVPYQRTHALAAAWDWDSSKPRSEIITNNDPAAPWTIGDTRSSHEKMVGWKPYQEIWAGGLNGALRAAVDAVNDWFKSRPWIRRR